MTSSSKRQYYLIPLFPPECLPLFRSLILALLVYCIASVSEYGVPFWITSNLPYVLSITPFWLLLFLSVPFWRSLCLLHRYHVWVFLSQMLWWYASWIWDDRASSSLLLHDCNVKHTHTHSICKHTHTFILMC